MSYVIEVLRQEHSSIERLLRVLERELNIFDRGDRPNYEVILAVIDYFEDYPDRCHHPKEDVIFENLKARNAVAAATVGDLKGEHREEARRLRRVAKAIRDVLSDQAMLREAVVDIIRDFIDHERQHMALEESLFFPAALNALRAEDWADVALKLADQSDPLVRPSVEEKFSILRRHIMELEEEAKAGTPG